MKIISLTGVSPDLCAEAMTADVEKMMPGDLLLGRRTEGMGGILLRMPEQGESATVALAITMVAAAHLGADYAAVPGVGSFRVERKYTKMLIQIDEALSAEAQAMHAAWVAGAPADQPAGESR